MVTAIGTFEDGDFPRPRRQTTVTAEKPKKCDAKHRFDRLVAPLQVNLLRYATWLCRDPDLAQEIIQETLFRAWRGLDSLQDETAVKQWLFTIARREHARLYERKKLAVKNLDYLTSEEKLQSAIFADDELYDVRREILSIKRIYREPLVLQVLLGFSLKEVADVLNLNVSAVGVRLHRARLELSKTMSGDTALVRANSQACRRFR